MNNPQYVQLEKDTARRLLNMLREYERRPKNTIRQPSGPRRPGASGAWYVLTANLAKCTSLSSIPSATAHPMSFTLSTTTLAAITTSTVTIYNAMNVGWTSTNQVWAEEGNGGVLWAIEGRACPDIT